MLAASLPFPARILRVLLYQLQGDHSLNMWQSCIHQVIIGLQWNLSCRKDFQGGGNSTMAKHKLTTFRQTDLAMHEYISKFSYLVEHAYTFTSTDPASMISGLKFYWRNYESIHQEQTKILQNFKRTRHFQICTWRGSKTKDQGFGPLKPNLIQ